jgi:hypothetical protein
LLLWFFFFMMFFLLQIFKIFILLWSCVIIIQCNWWIIFWPIDFVIWLVNCNVSKAYESIIPSPSHNNSKVYKFNFECLTFLIFIWLTLVK